MMPSENTQQPYLGPTRPARINRNSAGGPLIVGGTTYERGIGMQAAGKVMYTINGAFDKLTFSVAIDDSAVTMGRANVSVWADGRQIYQKTALAAGTPLQEVTLNIKNANTLELRADYLNNLDVQARVDWIAPVLRRP
jgi:alpha-galactosidase